MEQSNQNGEPRAEVQRRLWDRAAESYGARPLPDSGTDEFLQRIRAMWPDWRGMRFLDVGCGAGGYAIALAREGASGMGVDLSPKMIECARRRAEMEHAQNAGFRVLDWAEADIDALGYRGAFDVAFAHMTPALQGNAALEKMIACSRGVCLIAKPARRTDSVLDEALRRVGIVPGEGADDEIGHIFSSLWRMGACPEFQYRREVWQTERSVEEMAGWCADRARLRRPLTAQDEETIRSFVLECAENGRVAETTHVTRVTISWRVDER